MSGTSLDGLDIACCSFRKTAKGWTYALHHATTLRYSLAWQKKLATAHLLSGEELMALDADYGQYLGETCRKFVTKHKFSAGFVASHGHTVFHQPVSVRKKGSGFTLQIGNGFALHAACGLPVICDFRSQDVALRGEGAPLVPAGDKFLFSEYDVCLNLGGIANLSADVKGKRKAFDVCFMNMGLNHLAMKAGLTFDKNGAMAAAGEIQYILLKKLRSEYAKLRGKRPSLGREIFEKRIQSLLDEERYSLEDRLATFTESAAEEIANAIVTLAKKPKVLCTGGGAFNSYFISRLLENCRDEANLILPEEEVIQFKEALVFAFLGVLRHRGEINCLRSVTGAQQDTSGGQRIGF